jgi:hypothetical protein
MEKRISQTWQTAANTFRVPFQRPHCFPCCPHRRGRGAYRSRPRLHHPVRQHPQSCYSVGPLRLRWLCSPIHYTQGLVDRRRTFRHDGLCPISALCPLRSQGRPICRLCHPTPCSSVVRQAFVLASLFCLPHLASLCRSHRPLERAALLGPSHIRFRRFLCPESSSLHVCMVIHQIHLCMDCRFNS